MDISTLTALYDAQIRSTPLGERQQYFRGGCGAFAVALARAMWRCGISQSDLKIAVCARYGKRTTGRNGSTFSHAVLRLNIDNSSIFFDADGSNAFEEWESEIEARECYLSNEDKSDLDWTDVEPIATAVSAKIRKIDGSRAVQETSIQEASTFINTTCAGFLTALETYVDLQSLRAALAHCDEEDEANSTAPSL